MSFLCGNGEDFGIHFFGATHFGVSDFVWVVGRFMLHPSLGGGLWGGGLAMRLSLVGLLGFWQGMFAGVSRGPRKL